MRARARSMSSTVWRAVADAVFLAAALAAWAEPILAGAVFAGLAGAFAAGFLAGTFFGGAFFADAFLTGAAFFVADFLAAAADFDAPLATAFLTGVGFAGCFFTTGLRAVLPVARALVAFAAIDFFAGEAFFSAAGLAVERVDVAIMSFRVCFRGLRSGATGPGRRRIVASGSSALVHPHGGAERQHIGRPHEVDGGVRHPHAAVRRRVRRHARVPVDGDTPPREELRPVQRAELTHGDAVHLTQEREVALRRVRDLAHTVDVEHLVGSGRRVEDPLTDAVVRDDQQLAGLVDLDDVARPRARYRAVRAEERELRCAVDDAGASETEQLLERGD